MIKKHSPEGELLLVCWRCILNQAGPASELFKWLVTAKAAILTLIVVNLQSIKAVMDGGYLKASIILLITSILLSAIAYLLCVAVKLRHETSITMEGILSSEAGQETVSKITMSTDELKKELTSPFFGPFGILMRRSFDKGAIDDLSGDKGSMRLIVWQAYLIWSSLLLTTLAFVSIAVGLK